MDHPKKRLLACIFMCLVFLSLQLFAAGVSEQQPSSTVTATDALGRKVTLAGQPQRVVIPGKAAVMPADALFLFPASQHMDVILAKTDQGLGDFFNLLRPEFTLQQRLGQQVSAEEILALQPDLVLTKSSNYESIGKQLESFGIPLFVMDLESPEAWKEEITQLGILLGDTETPHRVRENFSRREQAVSDALVLLDQEECPSVLMMQVASADGITAFSVSPKEWIQTYIVEHAGGKPLWLDASLAQNAWRKVSFEQIAAWNPDHIYLISYKEAPDAFLKAIKESSQWNQLFAVQSGNIKATPADVMNYFQSDSRWILALQWLAADLHPSLFADFDMESEIAAFYRDFYLIEDQRIIDILLDDYRTSVGLP